MNKIFAKIAIMAMLVTPLAGVLPLAASAAAPQWDATGSYVVNLNHLGTDYSHDMNLTQDSVGNLAGNGGSPVGANTYAWTITSGAVSADAIDFLANYTATADAVTPQTVLHVTGVIAQDGTISGTWSDNYQGGQRAGTLSTASGNAVAIPPAPGTVKVTIVKYIDGTMATPASASNSDFPMSATWNAQNIGAGTGTYALTAGGYNGSTTPYQAQTADMTTGSDYTTNEITGGSVVGASCVAQGAPYALAGYSTGDTLLQAHQATPTMTAPAFTNMTSDKFVIVRNIDCSTVGSNGSGSIGGTVTQGNGVLHVDSILVVKSSSSANGTYEDGWKYVFRITDPTNEPKLAMKFSDWMSGTNRIPVANNMRISSAQADNGGATITLTATDTYSTPALNMVIDLDPTVAGRQVEITVEVKIPVGTTTGSYSTTYGVQSTP